MRIIFLTSSDVGTFVVKHSLEFGSEGCPAGKIPENEALSDQPLKLKAIKAVFRR